MRIKMRLKLNSISRPSNADAFPIHFYPIGNALRLFLYIARQPWVKALGSGEQVK